jgi:putative ABC transport system substrate-binding protein
LGCLSFLVLAQQPRKTPVVGLLSTNAPANDPYYDILRESLRDLGYEEGHNISLRIVSAEGQMNRLPTLAAELVDQGVDIIVATNDVSTRAAQKATTKIPIVMAGFGYDPVSLGLIDNVRRPGGNTTGTYSSTPDLEAKRLEVLKQAMPRVSHVAVLRDSAFGESALGDLRRAAKMLHVRLEFIELHSGDDLKSAFHTAKHKKVGAVLLLWSPIFYLYRDRVAALTLETKLPTVSGYAALQGTLMSYGPDAGESLRRAGYYVDRLLKGAQPSELPVEQLSKLKLIVNLRTAKALGIRIPASILVRADDVIQ